LTEKRDSSDDDEEEASISHDDAVRPGSAAVASDGKIRDAGLTRALTNREEGIIGWDGEDDPQNPLYVI
jgi:hypothetical protein